MLTDKRGFTLIEILIATLIFAIVSTAMYNVFIKTSRTTQSQRMSSEMRQNARGALEYMTMELNRMGYDVPVSGTDLTTMTGSPLTDPDTGPKLVHAASNEVYFTYKDLALTAPNNYRLVRYNLLGDEIKREKWEWSNPNWGENHTTDTLIDNVKTGGLSFVYYDVDENELTSFPLSSTDRAKVTRIKVAITTEQAKVDPVSGSKKDFTLDTEVALINMISETAVDTDPPPTPTITSVNTRNICGTLDVYWTASSDALLAGYVIQIATGSNIRQYTALADATSARLGGVRSSTDGATVSYLWPIPDGVLATVKMYAFDSSGNGVGNWSNAVSATPNADTPQQPKGLDATADADNVYLTWTDNSSYYNNCDIGQTNCDNDVKGYKVSRRVWTAGGTESWTEIADETTVTGPSYTDSIGGQNRCTTYDYKIQAVNRCDTNLVSADSATAYGDGAESEDDSPTIGTTNTTASESTDPAPPTNTISKAGFRRTFLNWKNPAEDDLSHIAIRYDSALPPMDPTYPSYDSGAKTFSGSPVEDISGEYSTSDTSADLDTIHTGSADGSTAMLNDGYKYAYSLFAVDRCNNVSTAALTAQTTASQCGEEEDNSQGGTTAGAPRWSSDDAGFTASCGTDNYGFSWASILDDASNVWDLAGYYVYRKDGTAPWTPSSSDTGTKKSGLRLNAAATWTGLDKGSAPTPDDNSDYLGNTYQYYVIPIDCWRETDEIYTHDPWQANPADVTGPDPLNSNVLTLTPGRTTFTKPSPNPLSTYPLPSNPYVTTGDLAAGDFLHNTVTAQIYNTAAGDVELDNFTISWEQPAAYLNEVEIWDIDNNTCLWGTDAGCATTISSPPKPFNQYTGSTYDVTFSPNVDLEGISGATCPTPPCTLQLELEFTDSAGTATSEQDMRGLTFDISSLQYTKTYLDDGIDKFTSCSVTNPRTYNNNNDDILVPSGPIILPPALPAIDSGIQEIPIDTATNVAGNATVPSQTISNNTIASTNDTNIVVEINDTSGDGISQAVLHYKESRQNRNTAPGTAFNTQTMFGTQSSGNSYTFEFDDPSTAGTAEGIPGRSEKRMWYYLLVEDNQGNWDRSPEIGDPDGEYYTYDMDNPCETTPAAPTGLAFTNATTIDVDGSGNVGFSWTAVTSNDDATAINDLAGYNVYVSASTDKGVSWSAFSKAGDTETNSFTYAPSDANGTWLKYYVMAYDTCAALNQSVASSTIEKVIKGTCANNPGVVSTSAAWVAGAGCFGSLPCDFTKVIWSIPADTDKDLTGLNIYSQLTANPNYTTSDTGYTIESVVTLTSSTTCTATVGTCSISGSLVTLLPPAASWSYTTYDWSARAIDYCGNLGNRGNEW